MSYQSEILKKVRVALKGEGYVTSSSDSIEAHNDDGELLVCARKRVHGDFRCMQKKEGAKYSLKELLEKKYE